MIGTNALAQTDVTTIAQPVFKHPKYKDSSWGDYIAIRSEHSPLRAKESYESCFVEQIIIECKLRANHTISDIKFSTNTPKFVQDRLSLSIIESAQYWSPKKKRNRYVDSKLVFAWGCILMRGCAKSGSLDSSTYYKYNNFKYIDICKEKKYKKYDYVEQFHTIIFVP